MSKFLKADLHMHTNNSDGSKSFAEIKTIIENSGGDKVVSITDHHHLTLHKPFEENNILRIPGIEISADANGKSVHITGYSLNPQPSLDLQKILQKIIEGYNDRAKRIYERWLSLGYNLPPLDEFRDNTLPPPIYKSDLVRQLGKIL